MRKLIATAIFALTVMHIQAQTSAVDVHSHIITPQYIEALQKHDALLDEGFPLPKWDVESHVQMMDKMGIATSVLSMPAPHPWWGDTSEASEVARLFNLTCASLERHYPNRFHYVASLPLPDVEAAIAEAKFAIDEMGAVGVKLATNVYGQYLGDAALEPLMAELDRRGAVVIVHPHKPVPVNDSIIKTAPMAIYEYPSETTRAVVNMIANGVTSRYPHIKWVIPHCGSFLPLAIERMKGVHPIMLRAGLMQPIDWSTATSNLYFDLAGRLTPEVLTSLLTITSPSHLLYGSDYPYVNEQGVAASKANVERVLRENAVTAAKTDDILSHNALRLFGLEQDKENKMDSTDYSLSAIRQRNADRGMIIRIAEIEVYPKYLDEYLQFALNVGATSVREEPGVVGIFPMIEKRDSSKLRIVEIYASKEAYEHHLTTAHFQTYKQGTLHMVKHLDLVEMDALNPDAMNAIFKKLK